MSIALSRVTAQGQVSIPAAVRRLLALGPGSVIEWQARGDQVIVRRAGRFSSADLHQALFPDSVPERRSAAELKNGIRRYVRRRHARD